jgi:hypothetical protein
MNPIKLWNVWLLAALSAATGLMLNVLTGMAGETDAELNGDASAPVRRIITDMAGRRVSIPGMINKVLATSPPYETTVSGFFVSVEQTFIGGDLVLDGGYRWDLKHIDNSSSGRTESAATDEANNDVDMASGRMDKYQKRQGACFNRRSERLYAGGCQCRTGFPFRDFLIGVSLYGRNLGDKHYSTRYLTGYYPDRGLTIGTQITVSY